MRNGQVSLHEDLPKEQVIIRVPVHSLKKPALVNRAVSSQRTCFATTPSSHLTMHIARN